MTFEIYRDEKKIGLCVDGHITPMPGYERMSDEWNGELVGYDGCGDMLTFIEGLMAIADMEGEEAECLLAGLCFSTHVPYAEGFRLMEGLCGERERR